MAITAHKLFTVADNQPTLEASPPADFGIKAGDVCAVLTTLTEASDAEGPGWDLPVT